MVRSFNTHHTAEILSHHRSPDLDTPSLPNCMHLGMYMPLSTQKFSLTCHTLQSQSKLQQLPHQCQQQPKWYFPISLSCVISKNQSGKVLQLKQPSCALAHAGSCFCRRPSGMRSTVMSRAASKRLLRQAVSSGRLQPATVSKGISSLFSCSSCQ